MTGMMRKTISHRKSKKNLGDKTTLLVVEAGSVFLYWDEPKAHTRVEVGDFWHIYLLSNIFLKI